MRRGQASSTATLVALLRALASTEEQPLVSDPAALDCLPRPWARVLGWLAKSRFASGCLRLAPELVSRGRLEHIALRTSELDALIEREFERGARQLVILGAGFDTRAHRLRALAGAVVFEVDHPATQRKKRERCGQLALVAGARRYVAADLERDALGPRLAAAGFDPGLRSVFVWEGVTMYLTLTAIKRTLAALHELASAGSSLLVTYYDASGASGPPSHATELLAALLGEPFRARFSAARAAELLAAFGFHVEADSGRADWARARGRQCRGSAQERIALARRVAGA